MKRLKNIIILLSLVVVTTLAIIGCDGCTFDEKQQMEYRLEHSKIIVIDSCEYIEYNDYKGNVKDYSLTHKGNCKYCQARLIKLLREINANK